MGNNSSRLEADPQAVYKAVAENNYCRLDALINQLRANQQLTPQCLGWVDKDGRTPLLVAASKNFHQCARKLLDCGADVLYLNNVADVRGGTALHEATRNRHEAMAELLLQHGATPFQCNALGKTCMDEAVLAASSNLLRRFEQLAPWSGYLAVKTSTLAGMSQTYKTRYCVVLPLLPAPASVTPGSGSNLQSQGQPVIRRQLWIYKDTAAVVPKCRVWLDGANVVRTTGDTDAVLRLHASHKPPQGDVYHRYDRGYCIYLRSKDASDPSVSMLHTFMAVVNSGTITSHHTSPSLPQAQVPSSFISSFPALPAPSGSSTSNTPLALPPLYPSLSQSQPQLQVYPSVPNLHSSSPSASTTPLSSLTPHGSSGGGSSAAGHAATAGSPPVFGTTSGQPAAAFVDNMNALPGETDEEFAQRLASAMTASTGQDQPSLHSRPSGSAPSCRPQAPAPTPARTTSPGPLAQALPTGWGAAPLINLLDEEPSAPPLDTAPHGHGPAATHSPAVPGGGTLGDDALCVICLHNPREAGYLHGTTLHRCVCRECCSEIKVGEPCPLCRLPVERVVGVF